MSLRRRPPRHATEMLLRRLTLVCLAVASMATSAVLPVILDTGVLPEITLPPGSDLSFRCRLKISGYKRFKLSWSFSPSEPSVVTATWTINRTVTPDRAGVPSNVSQEMELHLPWKASTNDSGWYFCSVREELPNMKENATYTSGKRVIITKIVEHTTLRSLVTDGKAPPSLLGFNYLWLLIPAGAAAFIVLLLICVLLKRRCCKKKAAQQPIYANTKAMTKQNQNQNQNQNHSLKSIPYTQNLRKPRPGRRYDEGKRKHKP